jgi:transposase-like protein
MADRVSAAEAALRVHGDDGSPTAGRRDRQRDQFRAGPEHRRGRVDRVRQRHFPNEQAALKCVYMALMSLDPTGAGRRRWTMRWKAPLNAFQIAFEGRLTPANY